MAKKKRKAKQRRRGKLTVDRKGRTGHFQGHMYSDVYQDGKAYVYTAWNDNEDVVGTAIGFEEWLKTYDG